MKHEKQEIDRNIYYESVKTLIDNNQIQYTIYLMVWETVSFFFFLDLVFYFIFGIS